MSKAINHGELASTIAKGRVRRAIEGETNQ